MYRNDYEGKNFRGIGSDDVFSRPVKAGKRTYFFDVKSTKENDYYVTITESKKRIENNGNVSFDKHKIFLYKEDFEKFASGLRDVVEYVKAHCDVQETLHEAEE